ncbi:hypothetical protein A3E06_00250 [Candidatus Giovannonibacteria bacterium RIFCSPHIGHO2_12_FULL_44_42]|nr:MAG: hypothetical protein A3E06_00250 [Candidatus Giovannonibacteria bacterium RIFCSPHIGHO2_12_FULL_44_42]
MSKLRSLFREFKRPSNIRILACAVLFAYVWGAHNWGDPALFSNGWWFDVLGHFIFGVGLSFVMLYWIKLYAPESYILSGKLNIARQIIEDVTIIEAIFWEGFEMLWDLQIQPNYASWLARAQNSSADTTSDIIITSLGAIFAMFLWWCWRKYHEKRWPNDTEKESIESAKAKSRALAKEILATRKSHRKQIYNEFKKSLKETVRTVKKIDPS